MDSAKTLAKDVMKKEVISVSPETPVKEIARIMVEQKISALPVVNKFNEILGVVSESDLISKVVKPHEPGIMTFLYHAALASSSEVLEYRKAMSRWNAQTAEQAMTSPAICVDKDEAIENVGRIMLDDKVKRVFVTEEGHLLGVISRSVFVELLLKEE
ncbi:MAG: CBS domain-containing protein [Succiniclasticum sp.]|uniref:CBS domain-containing protein n=1 Tax=Succiniclasticum sp. TaxID=2775030 RepID=UPI002A918077|nr:CBS domain-containing protein [Succiniclasticum sp.]MDY6292078.1 CBS domain-containing protein [Succiniclasticum sp.]